MLARSSEVFASFVVRTNTATLLRLKKWLRNKKETRKRGGRGKANTWSLWSLSTQAVVLLFFADVATRPKTKNEITAAATFLTATP